MDSLEELWEALSSHLLFLHPALLQSQPQQLDASRYFLFRSCSTGLISCVPLFGLQAMFFSHFIVFYSRSPPILRLVLVGSQSAEHRSRALSPARLLPRLLPRLLNHRRSWDTLGVQTPCTKPHCQISTTALSTIPFSAVTMTLNLKMKTSNVKSAFLEKSKLSPVVAFVILVTLKIEFTATFFLHSVPQNGTMFLI